MGMSVIEVANELGISRQRVMAIEQVALRKVRQGLLILNPKAEEWREYIYTSQKEGSSDLSIYF
jgi:DNA-directed RNA polymerase sigma subunit (sigma70/sigma32)